VKPTILFLFLGLMLTQSAFLNAQTDWPKIITTKNGAKITIYQPTPESFINNQLKSRSAISIQQKPAEDLIFGAIWTDAKMNTDRQTRMASLESIRVINIKFPDNSDTTKIGKLKTMLETEIPKWKLLLSMDDIVAQIEQNNPKASSDLNNTPPKIIYRNKNSALILVDGDPKLETDQEIKMKKVINSAFLILQDATSGIYYLYGGKYWYNSKSVIDGWVPAKKLPSAIADLDKQIKAKENAENNGTSQTTSEKNNTADTPPEIIVSTVPAELLQSNGDINLKPIEGTNLLYVSNSEDNIFMQIDNQQYYTLLSGRWYTSKSLQGPWNFVEADKLPADFAKIPEGSEKDIVLANVAGTAAANEAIMDAQIPQTAKVDRSKATCTVKYDGDPKFESIEGTNISVAKNTGSTVLRANNKYYCVENGVWYIAALATGPWTVSDERPSDVDKIPASNPAYNVKYVYIYESTPQYVYVGYTPGYMGCYVYGNVVVYGTGYYYNPWYGPYYYPYPSTYGFSMHYNPYFGWSMGFHYSSGYFHYTVVVHTHHGHWGPHAYRPPYHPPYHGGYYGGRPVHYGKTNVNVNINNSTNIYNNNRGVKTNNINRNSAQAPKQTINNKSNNPSTNRGPAGTNNLFAGPDGNVYKKTDDGNLQQRSNNQWQNADQKKPSTNQVNRQQQNFYRGQTRNSNFNAMNDGNKTQRSSRQSSSGKAPANNSGKRK
jgi:hypothetical protein